MSNKEIVCIIPARGGSKGIPGKNLIDLCGKPLLAWSITAAIATRAFSRIIVSTDSEEIATVAREWGAELPFMRPAHLARDDVHAMYVVLHALDWLKEQENLIPEGVMMLLPTSPMRLESDILGAINLFHKHSASSVISVIDLGKYLTNLRYLDDVRLMQVAPDENPNAQRQDLKKLFSVNGSIFLARPEVLRIAGTFHVDDAIGYVMDSVNSIDINAPEDLSLARRLCAALPPWKDESN